MIKLTIGMACYEDFDGVFFTLQAMRLYQHVQDVEFIVVDNNPDSPQGEATKKFVEGYGRFGNQGARYIAMSENTGTTQPRNRIFAEARGESVLVLDCHVLIVAGGIVRLLQYYREHAGTRDLLQGPMLLDNLIDVHTHFDPIWRAEMFGVWGTDERGKRIQDEPFEIPAQGLGLFSCRREAWEEVGGFNPHFRGFGGEEMYIHEKFRQADARTLCLPFLRWNHRFSRPNGVKYPLTRFNKVRNYVLGFTELGLPVEAIHTHFVKSGLMRQDEWDWIVGAPVNRTSPKPKLAETGRKQPPEGLNLDGLYNFVISHPRDLDQHAGAIARYVAMAKRVTAFVKRREWNAILGYSRPPYLTVYQSEKDPFLEHFHKAVELEQKQFGEDCVIEEWTTHFGMDSLTTDPIAETDMLVLDTIHHADRLINELLRHGDKVKRFIVLRGTAAFGEKAEGGSGPGLMFAVRHWMQEHPEWHITYRSHAQYGLMILSRDAKDPDVDNGPGSQLTKLLTSLGVTSTLTCDCRAKANQMDAWGPEGCRLHFDEIVAWMKNGQENWGWAAKLKAVVLASVTGLAFKLNPLDPFPGLIQEAIRLSEVEQNKLEVA